MACYDREVGRHEQKSQTNIVMDTAHRGHSVRAVHQPVRLRCVRGRPQLLGNTLCAVRAPASIHFAGDRHLHCLEKRMGWLVVVYRLGDLVSRLFPRPQFHMDHIRDHRGSTRHDWLDFPCRLGLEKADSRSISGSANIGGEVIA